MSSAEVIISRLRHYTPAVLQFRSFGFYAGLGSRRIIRAANEDILMAPLRPAGRSNPHCSTDPHQPMELTSREASSQLIHISGICEDFFFHSPHFVSLSRKTPLFSTRDDDAASFR